MYEPSLREVFRTCDRFSRLRQRISPIEDRKHAAESGYNRRSCFVPGGSCTRTDNELPSLMTVRATLACPLCFALTSAKRVTGASLALCIRGDRLRIIEDAFFFLSGDTAASSRNIVATRMSKPPMAGLKPCATEVIRYRSHPLRSHPPLPSQSKRPGILFPRST